IDVSASVAVLGASNSIEVAEPAVAIALGMLCSIFLPLVTETRVIVHRWNGRSLNRKLKPLPPNPFRHQNLAIAPAAFRAGTMAPFSALPVESLEAEYR